MRRTKIVNNLKYRFNNTISIVMLPQKSAVDNMNAFITAAKSCAAFGQITWGAECWNITDSQTKDRGHKQREYNLWFTQHQDGVRSSRTPGLAFIEPFASFVKALIRLRHEFNNQTCGNHMIIIQAMRYLYDELKYNNYNPVYLTTEHFIRSEKLIQNKLSPRTARQLGIYLVYIARILNDNYLTCTPLYFRTSVPAVESSDRLSESAKKRRYDLLPSQEIIDAIIEISHKVKDKADKIRINIIKILLFTGFRLGEVLTLPIDTLVKEGDKIGLRYWPEKGATTRIKWLPTVSGKFIEDVVHELVGLTQEARELAIWFDKNPEKLKCNIDADHLLSMRDVYEFVGLTKSVSNSATYCRIRKIPFTNPTAPLGNKRLFVKFKDLENALLKERWAKPMLRLANGKVQKLSQSLCVVFMHEFNPYRNNSKLLVKPIGETNISNFICGTSGVKTIFENYNYRDQSGQPFEVRSHGFRHLLNTLANEGGLTDIELANWFGRKTISDNASYDHRTAEQLTDKARQMMLSGEIVGPIAKAALSLPSYQASEFVDTHVNAVHYTPYGLCLHDFAQNPCDKHLNCLSNCKEYHRTVGSEEERNNLKQLKVQTVTALEHAKKEASNDTWGANNWVKHNQNILENIDKALSIDNDIFSE